MGKPGGILHDSPPTHWPAHCATEGHFRSTFSIKNSSHCCVIPGWVLIKILALSQYVGKKGEMGGKSRVRSTFQMWSIDDVSSLQILSLGNVGKIGGRLKLHHWFQTTWLPSYVRYVSCFEIIILHLYILCPAIEANNKVPPRFELGSLDSESRVLTITPWNLPYEQGREKHFVRSVRIQKLRILHCPGIEPGPPAWQASILPLNQQCWLESCWMFHG